MELLSEQPASAAGDHPDAKTFAPPSRTLRRRAWDVLTNVLPSYWVTNIAFVLGGAEVPAAGTPPGVEAALRIERYLSEGPAYLVGEVASRYAALHLVAKNAGFGGVAKAYFEFARDRLPAILARVPVGVNVGDAVEVEIRDKKLKARVVKYPFVRHGKACV